MHFPETLHSSKAVLSQPYSIPCLAFFAKAAQSLYIAVMRDAVSPLRRAADRAPFIGIFKSFSIPADGIKIRISVFGDKPAGPEEHFLQYPPPLPGRNLQNFGSWYYFLRPYSIISATRRKAFSFTTFYIAYFLFLNLGNIYLRRREREVLPVRTHRVERYYAGCAMPGKLTELCIMHKK